MKRWHMAFYGTKGWRFESSAARCTNTLGNPRFPEVFRGFLVCGVIPFQPFRSVSVAPEMTPSVWSWCKLLGKRTGGLVGRPCGLHRLRLRAARHVQLQHRQGTKDPGDVQQFRGGAHIGRQLRVRMPHRLLRGPKRDPALAQQRAEGGPQGVSIKHPPSIVDLGNLGGPHVPVENPHQPIRHVEQRHVRGQGFPQRPHEAFSRPSGRPFGHGHPLLLCDHARETRRQSLHRRLSTCDQPANAVRQGQDRGTVEDKWRGEPL